MANKKVRQFVKKVSYSELEKYELKNMLFTCIFINIFGTVLSVSGLLSIKESYNILFLCSLGSCISVLYILIIMKLGTRRVVYEEVD